MAYDAPAPGGSTYTLLQANLCLSGFAGCYGKVAYPSGVEAAVARIRAGRAHRPRRSAGGRQTG
jgi:hypothetical protein